MYKNFAKLFGLELDEEFKLYYILPNDRKIYKDTIFKIVKNGMMRKESGDKNFHFTDIYLHSMLLGTYQVERIIKN